MNAPAITKRSPPPARRQAARPAVATASAWRPGGEALSGTTANRRITDAYDARDKAMSAYLGTPAVCNWLTFAKYASASAGKQIAELETLQAALAGDPIAIGRALLNGVKKLARPAEVVALGRLVHAEFRRYEETLAEQGRSFSPLAQLGFLAYLNRSLDRLRDALVAGNTGVYENVLPAFDYFLAAERRGEDGRAALREAGYGGGPHDPQGLILAAFSRYRQAHALRQEAARASGTARDDLIARRDALIREANLLLVTNEQIEIVQGADVFGQRQVRRLVDQMGSPPPLVDPTGAYPLLPDGGNWTDFSTRMGFRKVHEGRPGALTIEGPAGVVRSYAPAPREEREGTIYSYFMEDRGVRESRRMIAGEPT